MMTTFITLYFTVSVRYIIVFAYAPTGVCVCVCVCVCGSLAYGQHPTTW
jgi:hypothetical protein